MATIKALTISQPFASMIADGEKIIENRSWSTPYRGRLAIHAGKGTQYMSKSELQAVPHGCVIATAELVACVRRSVLPTISGRVPGTNIDWLSVYRNVHAEGPWCWILCNVVKLDTPIEAVGKQGLWDWTAPEQHHGKK